MPENTATLQFTGTREGRAGGLVIRAGTNIKGQCKSVGNRSRPKRYKLARPKKFQLGPRKSLPPEMKGAYAGH